MEVVAGLHEVVEENLSLLAPVDQAWQPTDYLPDLTADDWADQLARFREPAAQLSNDLLVVLVGNMVTEEALPNYAVALEQIASDPTGVGSGPWARWLRGWTAEENRHGDLLNAYLRLTGRVDMRAIEQTIHNLIRGGFTPRNSENGYVGLVYASFQERATRITHGNVAKLASAQGDESLARICRKIAADETRHETFYTRIVGELMERDPEGAVMAFRAVVRGVLAMPGRLMFDGRDPDLFDHFAAVSQRLGTYTARNYAAIISHLLDAWKVADLSLSGQAARAQEYLCRQPERYERFADQIADTLAAQPPIAFSWIHGNLA